MSLSRKSNAEESTAGIVRSNDDHTDCICLGHSVLLLGMCSGGLVGAIAAAYFFGVEEIEMGMGAVAGGTAGALAVSPLAAICYCCSLFFKKPRERQTQMENEKTPLVKNFYPA